MAGRAGPVSPAHPDPDGSEELLSILDGRAESYQKWAAEYFERDVSLVIVREIYRRTPLSEEVVRQLNPVTSLAKLAADIAEIGYPLAEPKAP